MATTKEVCAFIEKFAKMRKAGTNQPFHMKDLTDYVLENVMVAPDTPGRILRMMKKQGKLSYTLLNRASSLYQFG